MVEQAESEKQIGKLKPEQKLENDKKLWTEWLALYRYVVLNFYSLTYFHFHLLWKLCARELVNTRDLVWRNWSQIMKYMVKEYNTSYFIFIL